MATPNNVEQDKEESAIHNTAEGLMSPALQPHLSPIQETRRPYNCKFCFKYLEFPAATNHHCDLSIFCEIDSLELSPSDSVSGSVIDCDLRSEIDESSRSMSPYDESSGNRPDELVLEAIAVLNKPNMLERSAIAAESAPISSSADDTTGIDGDARLSTECRSLDQPELSIQSTRRMSSRLRSQCSNTENVSDFTNGGNSNNKNSMRLSDENVSQTLPAANASRNFQFDICQRSFGVKGNLQQHMRIHSNKRRYECTACSKAFSIKENLVRHLRTHSGEKPYRCEVCSKVFSQKGNMVCHLRTHSGEKPYKCKVCSKRFSRKDYLVCHLRAHSGEKPYRCEVCSKHFSTNSNCTKHIKGSHKVSAIITKPPQIETTTTLIRCPQRTE